MSDINVQLKDGEAAQMPAPVTVGEALNILERFDLGAMPREQALHLYLEASALAFADRGKYVGDPAFVGVPIDRLLGDTFAAESAPAASRCCFRVDTLVQAELDTIFDGIKASVEQAPDAADGAAPAS